jgi:hypothetical protein
MFAIGQQWQRWRFCALLALCLGLCPSLSHAADEEALIKAGFISKFPSYVTWPGQGGTAVSQPFVFCVLGDSPLTNHLISLVALDTINGQPALVRSLSDLSEAGTCHLLVLPSGQSRRLPTILREFGDQPLLLVGDAPGLAAQGAHIALFRSQDRVGFAVNRNAFRRSGLQISFRLLEMARVVE